MTVWLKYYVNKEKGTKAVALKEEVLIWKMLGFCLPFAAMVALIALDLLDGSLLKHQVAVGALASLAAIAAMWWYWVTDNVLRIFHIFKKAQIGLLEVTEDVKQTKLLIDQTVQLDIIGTPVTHATSLLSRNKEYIQAECMSFLRANYTDKEYNREICYRDIGLVIDSVIFDIYYNREHLIYVTALSFFKSRNIMPMAKRNTSVQLLKYAKKLSVDVIHNTSAHPHYQNKVKQVINIQYADGSDKEVDVNKLFEIAINSLEHGPESSIDK